MRNLKATDLPELTDILQRSEAFTEVEIACALELLEIVINDPHQLDYRAAVAVLDGRASGYILYGPVPLTEGCYDIYWIAVDPACQGRGLGRRLLTHAEGEARSAQGRLMCLETSSQAHYGRTREFYRLAGYREESRIRDFYRPGDDRLTYVKRFTTMEES